jgi:hypothetical protein
MDRTRIGLASFYYEWNGTLTGERNTTRKHSRLQGATKQSLEHHTAGARDQERCGITTPHLIRQPAQWFCPPL